MAIFYMLERAVISLELPLADVGGDPRQQSPTEQNRVRLTDQSNNGRRLFESLLVECH